MPASQTLAQLDHGRARWPGRRPRRPAYRKAVHEAEGRIPSLIGDSTKKQAKSRWGRHPQHRPGETGQTDIIQPAEWQHQAGLGKSRHRPETCPRPAGLGKPAPFPFPLPTFQKFQLFSVSEFQRFIEFPPMISSTFKTRVRYGRDRQDGRRPPRQLPGLVRVGAHPDAGRARPALHRGRGRRAVSSPVLGARIDYRRGARFDDRLEIRLSMKERPKGPASISTTRSGAATRSWPPPPPPTVSWTPRGRANPFRPANSSNRIESRVAGRRGISAPLRPVAPRKDLALRR